MYNSISVFILIFLFVSSQNIVADDTIKKNNSNSQHKNQSLQTDNNDEKDIEYYLVKFDKLQVMDSPSSFANVLGTLAKGDTVKSIGFTISTNQYDSVSKLVKFNYRDKVGYVNSLYLQKVIDSTKVAKKPDAISIYAGIIFVSTVMFLGLLSN